MTNSSHPKATDLHSALQAINVPELGPLPEFGPKMKEMFMLDPNYLILNHGSYGSIPKYVHEYYQYYSACSEFNPDIWMRSTAPSLYYQTLERMAKYVGCKDPKDLVFVQNTSSGLNSVLRSMEIDKNDALFRFSTSYGACSNAIQYVCDTTGALAVDVPINLPCSSDDIIESTRKTIQKVKDEHGRNIKFAMIDTISSVPGIVIPYIELSKLFKNEGAIVFIDGSHALGQMDFCVDEMDCDYFVTNPFKGFYTKRGIAIFYVAKHLQQEIQPLAIAWAYSLKTGWRNAFFTQGTSDYSAFLSVNAAADFVEAVGGIRKVKEYCHNLAIEGKNLMESKYGMAPMTRDEKQIPNMINCKLPLQFGNPIHDKVGGRLSEVLLTKKNSSGFVYAHNGAWWIRLYAQIYLDLHDFDKFGKVLTETIEEEITAETENI
ncbi:hypothetical protein BB559_000526 [Furculomyces boomerangus]|uniref:Aminotransferase class V domain-containing protein n=1 Tax=Furculomyces boomerangus TaxID=61424 RepID=A0A2T9Z4U4_9FUNG|nr:hypothetical protein BB559_000526 [Furculomyces boomerangus]